MDFHRSDDGSSLYFQVENLLKSRYEYNNNWKNTPSKKISIKSYVLIDRYLIFIALLFSNPSDHDWIWRRLDTLGVSCIKQIEKYNDIMFFDCLLHKSLVGLDYLTHKINLKLENTYLLHKNPIISLICEKKYLINFWCV